VQSISAARVCQATPRTTAGNIPKRQAAPQTDACGILLRPGYPFTPFNSVQLRSKGGWSFSRGHRTCLAGSEQVTHGYYRACLPSRAANKCVRHTRDNKPRREQPRVTYYTTPAIRSLRSLRSIPFNSVLKAGGLSHAGTERAWRALNR